MSLKEPSNPKSDPIAAYLTAISIVGIAGLALMLGGAIALRNGAQFHEDIVGIFMLMTFLIVAMVEVFLCRQLSRITRTAEKRQSLESPVPASELRAPQPSRLAEPVPSVTENTTRTLEYSRNEPLS
jgi:hypothetical protein